jgi:Phage integrase, N-terminal SAM-like domain
MAKPDPTSPSLVGPVNEYLDWQALDRGRSSNTVPAYATDIGRFQKAATEVGVELLAGVDRDLLCAFQSAMARGDDRDEPLSPQTRHRRLVALRSFLRLIRSTSSMVAYPSPRSISALSPAPMHGDQVPVLSWAACSAMSSTARNARPPCAAAPWVSPERGAPGRGLRVDGEHPGQPEDVVQGDVPLPRSTWPR